MGPVLEWSWLGFALGYAWIGLLAVVLFFWQRRRPAERRVSLVPPLLFCGLTTLLQQLALLATIGTRMVQSWHGPAVLVIHAGVPALAGILWLRSQEKGRPFHRPTFAGLLGVGALPLAFALLNSAGWLAAPAERPGVVELVLRNGQGAVQYWFVRLGGVGEVAVTATEAQAFPQGGPARATVGRGLLGAERVTSLRTPP